MQVSVESTSPLGRKMKVQVPAERIDTEVQKRLQSLSKDVRIAGFRPGKVPMRIVKQRYGGRVKQEVIGEVMRTSYQEAVAQEKLRPASGPEITPETDGDEGSFGYTATFEVYPEVQLAVLGELEVMRPVAHVTEQDVDAMVETLRSQHKVWTPVQRASQQGDKVSVDFTGRIEDEVFEGGEAKNVEIELGEGHMVPGFEDQLVGVEVGGTRAFDVTFPENYRDASLANKIATFDVRLNEVFESELPNLDSEFFKLFDVKNTGLNGFREQVKKNMERELDGKVRAKVKPQVMAGLVRLHQIEAPFSLVGEEIQRMRRQMMASLQAKEESKFPDSVFEEEAHKRIILGLIIREIVKQHELKLDERKLQDSLDQLASAYDDPQQVISYYRTNHEAMASLEALVLEEQVVDWVLEQAKVVEDVSSFHDLVD